MEILEHGIIVSQDILIFLRIKMMILTCFIRVITIVVKHGIYRM